MSFTCTLSLCCGDGMTRYVSSANFTIEFPQSEIGKRAIKFKFNKLWNNLPTDIKEIQSCSSFKYKIVDYLLESLE